MVRNPPPRATTKGKWSSDHLDSAVQAIGNGRKIREVGRSFGIPEPSLLSRMKKGQFNGVRLGRKPVFSLEQEVALMFHAITLSNLFYEKFLKRIPEVCLRKPALTSHARIKGFNRYAFRPCCNFNVDETGIRQSRNHSVLVLQKAKSRLGWQAVWKKAEPLQMSVQ
ncbi:hypothetical protein PR048_000530 [Dryococelus australis]|uniref:HTH psq-type domain-containing protein n=1 Tax=Dryococelus australis TaxID=614101 RepID=A0ABQ9IEX3_9NEOP|nr:hypothetical protein PR048_000530 [Dryococelus australis]